MQTKESLPPHWQHIRDLYISGFPSIRELARQNGLSDTAIHKRAKAEGWERNESRKPKRQPDRKPWQEDPPRQRPQPAVEPSIPQAIADAADADPGELIKETRVTLKRLHEMLRWETGNIDWLEQVIEDETDGDKSDRRREAMLKAVSMPTLILAAKNLALALKTLADAAPGKKQQAQDAAETAGEGTGWGDDLNVDVARGKAN